MRTGDMRVGLDLVKRSVMVAERAGMDVVTTGHVGASIDSAMNAPLDATIQALCTDERKLYGHIAGKTLDSGVNLTTGAVFESLKEYMPISYTAFYEKLRKLDEMRLIELISLKGRGNTREIALRYDAEKVMKLTGYWE
jgi:cell division control protein 6